MLCSIVADGNLHVLQITAAAQLVQGADHPNVASASLKVLDGRMTSSAREGSGW